MMRASKALTTMIALGVALTFVILGCGDEGSATTTITETGSAATLSTTSTAETQASTGGNDGAPPPADTTVDELTGFTSPTGNVGCIIDRETVRCDIAERDWEPPAAPASCQLDYGQGLKLSAGGAADLVCAGDTTLGAGEPLAYGQSIAAGLLRCESAESGISCRDVETGRGFTISRESYEIF